MEVTYEKKRLQGKMWKACPEQERYEKLRFTMGSADRSGYRAVGTGIMGAMAGGEKEFCQEIESCEDVNF